MVYQENTLNYQISPLTRTTVGSGYVVCNGCPENRIDVARAENYLTTNGWHIAKDWHDADLILFNACGRSMETTHHSLRIIKELQTQKRPNQQLIVWGCLPKIDPAALYKEYHGTVCAGEDLTELPDLMTLQTSIDQVTGNSLGPVWPITRETAQEYARYSGSRVSMLYKRLAIFWEEYTSAHFNMVDEKDHSIFYIKVSTGCRSKCAYCAIRKSRGLTKSKPIAQIAAEFKNGIAQGYQTISLMGTDLGSYGVDIGVDLADLLTELVKQEGNYTINLRNVHPYHLTRIIDKFVPVLKTNKIRYMEIAAESGSNRILKLMNRNYTIEEYSQLLRTIRQACPKILIRTQIIAGFPTETEEEFQETIKLLDDIVFDFVEVYEFSARPGTIAENLQPQVPDVVKRQRFVQTIQKSNFKPHCPKNRKNYPKQNA